MFKKKRDGAAGSYSSVPAKKKGSTSRLDGLKAPKPAKAKKRGTVKKVKGGTRKPAKVQK